MSAEPSDAAAQRGFRAVSHTADLGMDVWAGSWADLYAMAAEAMFSLMGDPTSISSAAEFTQTSSGIDREDLMVRLLSDLLRRFEVENLYVTKARGVRVDEPATTGDEWRVTIAGDAGRVDRVSESGLIEFKAITYHDLFVDQTADDRFEARVIFDL